MDSEEYVEAIRCLLGDWLVFGENCRKFEKEFPVHLGKEHGILTNSGSSANLLMTYALLSKTKMPSKYRLNKGDKFITPTVCFPTTLNPLLQLGFEPVFVDVDIPSLNINLDQVEEILEKDVDREIKGLIFAHVLGNPPNMNRVMQIVEKYNLVFLEDACDALGSTFEGRALGSFGHMSSCSFYPAHHMTLGEGGFVATNDYAIHKTLASLRDWGRACYCNEKRPGNVVSQTACGNRFRCWFPSEEDLIYDHRYVFDEVGFNLKPLDIQGAIGLQQLKKLPQMEAARRSNFKTLLEVFKPYEEFLMLPQATHGSDPSWFAFMPLVKDNPLFTKNDIVSHLEAHKIQTRPYFTGQVLYHPAYRNLGLHEPYGNLKERFPNAHLATTSSFLVGTYIGIDDRKMNQIQVAVDSFFSSVRSR
tara:strand:- start:12098 stop:13351 length:1254 start_codon:yes stop_codon:yes gene_type:complete